MIIIELNGGVGNQMFEYASAFMIAKKNGVQLKVDPSHLTAWHIKKKWNPEILNLNISKKVCTKTESRKFLLKTGVRYFDMFLGKMGWFEKNVYSERKGVSFEEFSNVREGYLMGFFIDSKYFDVNNGREIFRKEFELKDKTGIVTMLENIKKSNSVSVHVRRGDLLKIKGAYVLSKNYYKKAIRLIKEKVKNPMFYFFSDDIGWCEKAFGDLENCVFVKGNGVLGDFELMKNCKHNILANSTLSWWSGYLNYNKSPVVIAPKHFGPFEDKVERLILKKWISLDC